jgi:hypothetical protein
VAAPTETGTPTNRYRSTSSRPIFSVGVGRQELVAVTWTRRLSSRCFGSKLARPLPAIAFWLLREGCGNADRAEGRVSHPARDRP